MLRTFTWSEWLHILEKKKKTLPFALVTPVAPLLSNPCHVKPIDSFLLWIRYEQFSSSTNTKLIWSYGNFYFYRDHCLTFTHYNYIIYKYIYIPFVLSFMLTNFNNDICTCRDFLVFITTAFWCHWGSSPEQQQWNQRLRRIPCILR